MDFTWLFIQMLLTLAVVCIVAVILLRFVVPKLSWARKWQKSGNFELVDRFGLDYKRAIYLVRVGKKHLVLGGSDQGLHLLKELAPEDVHTKEHKDV